MQGGRSDNHLEDDAHHPARDGQGAGLPAPAFFGGASFGLTGASRGAAGRRLTAGGVVAVYINEVIVPIADLSPDDFSWKEDSIM